MRTLLLATLLLVTACKKKDEAKPAEPAAVEKKAEATPTPAAAASGIASLADYEARATDLTNKLLALFGDAGTDCDKLAANLTKFSDDNRALFEALEAYEKTNPEAEKAFDEKMQGREKEFDEKLAPVLDACKDHAGLQAALQKLPG